MRTVDVPMEQRMEYNGLVDKLHQYAQEVDPKLPMYYLIIKQEEVLKKLIAIVCSLTFPFVPMIFTDIFVRYRY